MAEEWSDLQYQILELLAKGKATYAEPVVSRILGTHLNITPSYIRRKMRPLQEKGIVGVRRGKGGGYYLKENYRVMLKKNTIKGGC